MICRFYLQNNCRFGNSCKFKHDNSNNSNNDRYSYNRQNEYDNDIYSNSNKRLPSKQIQNNYDSHTTIQNQIPTRYNNNNNNNYHINNFNNNRYQNSSVNSYPNNNINAYQYNNNNNVNTYNNQRGNQTCYYNNVNDQQLTNYNNNQQQQRNNYANYNKQIRPQGRDNIYKWHADKNNQQHQQYVRRTLSDDGTRGSNVYSPPLNDENRFKNDDHFYSDRDKKEGLSYSEIATEDYVELVRIEVTNWLESLFWPFSCYGFLKYAQSLPDLLDLSFEEMRLNFYEAKSCNQLNQFDTRLKSLAADYNSIKNNLINASAGGADSQSHLMASIREALRSVDTYNSFSQTFPLTTATSIDTKNNGNQRNKNLFSDNNLFDTDNDSSFGGHRNTDSVNLMQIPFAGDYRTTDSKGANPMIFGAVDNSNSNTVASSLLNNQVASNDSTVLNDHHQFGSNFFGSNRNDGPIIFGAPTTTTSGDRSNLFGSNHFGQSNDNSLIRSPRSENYLIGQSLGQGGSMEVQQDVKPMTTNYRMELGQTTVTNQMELNRINSSTDASQIVVNNMNNNFFQIENTNNKNNNKNINNINNNPRAMKFDQQSGNVGLPKQVVTENYSVSMMYTPMEELSELDLMEYNSSTFTYIPIKPPPRELI